MSTYNICGISRQGLPSVKNCDNIYMNGIYMDSFTFSRYEKELTVADESSLFVICAGHEESDFSNEILREIKEKTSQEDCNTAQKLISAAVEVVVMADIKQSQNAGRKLDVGIVVVDGNNVTAICFGNIGIMVREGTVTSNICFGDAVNAIGTGNVAGGTAEPIRRTVSDNSRILLYTEEISEKLSMRDFDGCLVQESSVKCIKAIDEILNTKSLSGSVSAICIDVLPSEEAPAALSNSDKGMKMIITGIAVAFIIVLICAAVFLFGMGGNSKETSETVSRINAEQRDRMDLKERIGILSTDLDAIDKNAQRVLEIAGDKDAKALDIDVRLLNAGAADWEFLANSDEAKALGAAIDEFNKEYKPRDEVMKGTDSGSVEERTKAVESAEEYAINMGKLFGTVEEKYELYIGAYNNRVDKAKSLEGAKANQKPEEKRTASPTQKSQKTQAPASAQKPNQAVVTNPPVNNQTQAPVKNPVQTPAPKVTKAPATKSPSSGGSFGSGDQNGEKLQ